MRRFHRPRRCDHERRLDVYRPPEPEPAPQAADDDGGEPGGCARWGALVFILAVLVLLAAVIGSR